MKYYLIKMQPNALLIWQNFIIVKSGCYKPTPLKSNLALKIQEGLENNSGNLL
jgi:hypothetical protein